VTYCYRMQQTFTAPQDAIARLSSIKQPLAVLIGSEDELLYADRFAPLINRERSDVCRSPSSLASIIWEW
jgi:hypothetical protein